MIISASRQGSSGSASSPQDSKEPDAGAQQPLQLFSHTARSDMP